MILEWYVNDLLNYMAFYVIKKLQFTAVYWAW